MGRKEGKLPLPEGFFQVPRLDGIETSYLINLAKQACKEVVYYSRGTGGPINWVPLFTQERSVLMYQGIDETEIRSITYYRGTTRIYASIDEIADFFKQDSVEKIAGFSETVGKDLLDQHTLYDLALPTEENPKHYVGVKWAAVESPSKIARNRDFCFLECHDEFVDTIGKKRGWVRSLHSIRLPCCPSLRKSHGLVRGSLYRCGYVFIESENRDYVDAIHTVHMDIKGKSPSWIKLMAMTARTQNIAQINRYFLMKRLCRGRLLGDLELPVKRGVEYCQLCDHKFRVLRRKWRCRKCGKVTCTKCTSFHLLDYAGTGARKVCICNLCCDEATLHHQHYYHSDSEEDKKYVIEGQELLDQHSHRQLLSLPPVPNSRNSIGRPSGSESRLYSRRSHSHRHSSSVQPQHSLDHGGKYRNLRRQDTVALEAKLLQKEFEDSFSMINHLHRQNGMNSQMDIRKSHPRNLPSSHAHYSSSYKHNSVLEQEQDYNELNVDFIETSNDDGDDDDDEEEEDHHLDGPYLMMGPENSRCGHVIRQRESLDSIQMNSEHGGTFVGDQSRVTNFSGVSNNSPPKQDRHTPLKHSQETVLPSKERKGSPLTREDLSFGRDPSTVKQLEQLQRSFYEAKNKRSKGDHDICIDESYMPQPSENFLSSYDVEDSNEDENMEYELEDHSYRPLGIQHKTILGSRGNSNFSRHSSNKSQKNAKRQQLEQQVNDGDKLAESLALAAMNLYEKQHGQSYQQNTRQAALKKMIEMYTQKLQESKTELAVLKGKRQNVTTRNRAATHDDDGQLVIVQSTSASAPIVANLSELSASTFQKHQQRVSSDNVVLKKHLMQVKYVSDGQKDRQEYEQLEQLPSHRKSSYRDYSSAHLNHFRSREEIEPMQGEEEEKPQHQLYDHEQNQELSQVQRPSSLMINPEKTSSMDEEGRTSSLTLSTHDVDNTDITYQQMEGECSEEEDNEDRYSSFDLGIVSLPHLMRANEDDDVDIIDEPYEHAIADELSPVSSSTLSGFEEYVQADASHVTQQVVILEKKEHHTDQYHVFSINGEERHTVIPENVQEPLQQLVQSDVANAALDMNFESTSWNSSSQSHNDSSFIHFHEFEADHDDNLIASPPSGIDVTYGTDSNDSENATSMSIYELEQYRDSISELLQEYEARESNMNRQHRRGHGNRRFSSTSCEELIDRHLLRRIASSQLENDVAFQGSLQYQPEEEPWYAEKEKEEKKATVAEMNRNKSGGDNEKYEEHKKILHQT
jgi:hypothetical protein